MDHQWYPVLQQVEDEPGWEERLKERQLNVLKYGWWLLPDGSAHEKLANRVLEECGYTGPMDQPNGAPCPEVFLPSWAWVADAAIEAQPEAGPLEARAMTVADVVSRPPMSLKTAIADHDPREAIEQQPLMPLDLDQ
jgi:hypothetical protein